MLEPDRCITDKKPKQVLLIFMSLVRKQCFGAQNIHILWSAKWKSLKRSSQTTVQEAV